MCLLKKFSHFIFNCAETRFKVQRPGWNTLQHWAIPQNSLHIHPEHTQETSDISATTYADPCLFFFSIGVSQQVDEILKHLQLFFKLVFQTCTIYVCTQISDVHRETNTVINPQYQRICFIPHTLNFKMLTMNI